jgi:GlpG protein
MGGFARSFPLRRLKKAGGLIMRKIGYIERQEEAQALSNLLLVEGIDNQIEEDGQQWAVWVHEEDQLAQAGQLLKSFQAKTVAADPVEVAAKAAQLRAAQSRANTNYRDRVHTRGELRSSMMGHSAGPITILCVVISAIAFILLKLGRPEINWFFITENPVIGFGLDRLRALTEIEQGQIWRLITPIFIHFGFLHILFNLMWMMDLGGMVETRQGSRFLALQLTVIAIVSNLAQYLVANPTFGGLSGVVYGLLGYIWIRGKYDLTSGYFLHPTTVGSMLIWFFACLLGLVSGVANTTHAAGLILGMVWGYAASRVK